MTVLVLDFKNMIELVIDLMNVAVLVRKIVSADCLQSLAANPYMPWRKPQHIQFQLFVNSIFGLHNF